MIAIVDCNNFYASCERLFNPKLRDTPICILSNNDGCVISRSNEAKALDIPMGAAYHIWKDEFEKKGIKVFSSNYALYGDISARIMTLLKSYVKKVEVYSIDEAFLDLTEQAKPYEFCAELAQTVYQYTGIPVSIGLASTKTLAKVANRIGKHENKRLYMITEADRIEKLSNFEIGHIWGIGRQLSSFLKKEGVHYAHDLIIRPDTWIKKHMTKVGLWTAMELRGQQCFPFTEVAPPKKSILATRSFGSSLRDKQVISEAIASHVARAAEKLRRQKSIAGGISVSINTNRFKANFKYLSKYIQFTVATSDTSVMIREAMRLFDQIYDPAYAYHKCGIGLGEITTRDTVQETFWESGDTYSKTALLETVDAYNRRHGKNTIFFGAMGTQKKWALRSNFRSKRYTTSFKDLLEIAI